MQKKSVVPVGGLDTSVSLAAQAIYNNCQISDDYPDAIFTPNTLVNKYKLFFGVGGRT